MSVLHFRSKPRGPVSREKIPVVDNATVEVPQVSIRTVAGVEVFKPCFICLLSDAGAMALGAQTARSMDGQFVIVTLNSGRAVTIGKDRETGELVIRPLGERTVIRPVDLGE